jgi:hypothetical protein
MKDKNLIVRYCRTENDGVVVFLYRSEFHIATIQVDASNAINLAVGLENKSKVRVRGGL